MLPVLVASSKGEVRIGQVVDELANQLGLSQEERSDLPHNRNHLCGYFRLFRTLRSICYEYSMPKSHFRIPAYDGPLRRRIRLLVKANPKRGKAALRFAKYRDGMTVEEYMSACEDVGTPNYAVFDITWDTDPKRKFIELYD